MKIWSSNQCCWPSAALHRLGYSHDKNNKKPTHKTMTNIQNAVDKVPAGMLLRAFRQY